MVHNTPDSQARSQRACDNCRKRKSRCSGRRLPENKCSSCLALDLPCLTTQSGRKRPPPPGYVEGLEQTIEKLRKILIHVKPDFDIDKDVDELTQMPPSPPADDLLVESASKDVITNVIRTIGIPLDDASDNGSDNEAAHLVFPGNQKNTDQPLSGGVYGKSSSAYLARQIMLLKSTSDEPEKNPENLQFWRPSFWAPTVWELPPRHIDTSKYPFPDDDLLHSLLDLYFAHTGYIFPFMHRPTIEKKIAAREHYSDYVFGANVMLMCCIAARLSDDPRVLWDDSYPKRSAGWRWFHQVHAVKGSPLLNTVTLGELQYTCLVALFTSGSNVSLSAWISCGVGLRMAQFAGAHRHLSYGKVHTIENEMWKRTFWALLVIDIYHSGTMGRPCIFFQMDLDLPTECDDEYMEDPNGGSLFTQPPNQPSQVTFFVRFIHLMQILSFVLRTVYSLKRLRIRRLGATNAEWVENLVTELDSAMNKWLDKVPQHLRWDPNIENDLFLDQSALLYGNFYFVQILIHRPFVALGNKPSSLNFPSLLICTNAARACCHIADIHFKRKGVPNLLLQLPIFTSGLILLMGLWIKRRSSKVPLNLNKEMVEVHKCIRLLEACEDKWHAAGRLRDILQELSAAGNLPLPREHDLQTSGSSNGSPSPAASVPDQEATIDPQTFAAWDNMFQFDTSSGFPNLGLGSNNQFTQPFENPNFMPGHYASPTDQLPSFDPPMGPESSINLPFAREQTPQNLFFNSALGQLSNVNAPQNWQYFMSQLMSPDPYEGGSTSPGYCPTQNEANSMPPIF